MDRLVAMQVFVEVADRGSLTAAADHLDMSRAMVSRYLAELEEWVGARLFHRTTRKLSLTSAGSDTLPRCRQLLDMAGDIQSSAATPENAPRGTLRLTCSMSLGQAYLAPLLARFLKRYPGTAVSMLLVDRAVNLIEERVDLAIRITNSLDPNLIARKLAVCRSVVCASPDYLQEHGTPKKAEDLALHNCLTYSYFGKSLWEFEKDGVPVAVPVGGNMSANESSVLLEAAVSGAGITMQPVYAAAKLLRSGKLRALLTAYQPREMSIYGVYASRRQMPAILRAMLDFLVEEFSADPDWETPVV
ncbi:bacterial regulatory helix-turn-helix, lysR family protein [Collimonas arenae]|uniref:Bacterial regulatory helix-turn-helix, lysR family protein n=1 Tax=Collimonas arenae TaxID=279058 RepID=A0A127PMU0_9BURK|nr:LysR family transcriptional regulator [Collimonas arenae]AMO99092.1 bacterial regulatory helix-turn-helix, lysR family protein [Collimonas arenae]AMP08992.1 bacterial regulatory helix-turn-helix, lysR family protein [Collimonas arenae]